MDSRQQPAFCFSMPDDDFDPNHEPIDGEQYLQSVIYERNKCPAVVVKPLETIAMGTPIKERNTVRFVWDQYTEVRPSIFPHRN